MKKINEKQAIVLSMSLYHWLAVTGKKSKEDYERFHKDKIWSFWGHCPCCEFYREDNGRKLFCGKCPLGSCSNNSLWNKWFNAKTKKQCSEAARDVYKKLEKYYSDKWRGIKYD